MTVETPPTAQQAPAWGARHLLSTAELLGRLDEPRLVEALELTTARLAPLRTVFEPAASGWTPRVLKGWTPRIVRQTVPASSDETAVTTVHRLVQRVLDPALRPAVEFTLTTVVRDDRAEQLLTVLAHEALVGRQGLTTFWQVLAESYRELGPAGAAQLEPRRHVRAEVAAGDTSWPQGAPTVLELPSDLTRPATWDTAAARLAFGLSDRAAAACEQVAAECSVRRAEVLVAAWSLVLARRAGVDDLVLGDTAAGSGVVPVRCRLVETSGREYVRQLSAARADAEGLDVRRAPRVADDPSRSSLVQFAVDLPEDGLPARMPAGDVEFVLHEGFCGTTSFDASLVLLRWTPKAELALDYATSVLLPSEATALADSLDTALVELHAALDEPLESVRTISDAQHARLRSVRTGPVRDSSGDVWQMVEAIAREHPESEAVNGPDLARPLRYRDLVPAVERLAALLAEVGVGPGVNVPIAHARSAKEVVSVLAVLRCGGTYVAFDASAPDERLQRMFAATVPGAIVGDPDLVDRVRRLSPTRCATVIAPDPLDAGGGGGTPAPAPPVDPDRAAYITFTSGSTGVPKAVRIPHRGVVRLVRDPAHIRSGPGERMLRFAPLAFDASTLELFAPLANGGSVEVLPHELPSPEELATFVKERGVTVLWLTAGLFRLVADLAPHAFTGVRQVLTGGDVVPPEQARRLLEHFPGLRVSNCYGPTENTTFSTVHHLDDPCDVEAPLPIGTPLAETGLLVLDSAGRQVPPGGVGELYVTGAGLAIDYLGAPDQTRAAFGLPAPDNGERTYRTGDIVRLDAHDRVRFLGRADHQVKIRGFRIETDEIVARLLEHPLVRDAVVVAVGTDASSRRLLAGVVADAAPRLDITLRAHLSQHLSSYAVPALWAFVDRIPLTTNGKVDRNELERASERFLAERRRR